MALHEHLTRIPKRQLREVGWTKARELRKEEFKREVKRHLTGQETEPWELVYCKLYKSQLPVVEQALETAALLLGTNKSRGRCLEMISATSWPEPASKAGITNR